MDEEQKQLIDLLHKFIREELIATSDVKDNIITVQFVGGKKLYITVNE